MNLITGEWLGGDADGTNYHVLFGGFGGSSYGLREQGKAAAGFDSTAKAAFSSGGRV